MHALDTALQKGKPEDFVYLLEDDYIHRPGSKNALLEALEIADYVTLYDHPDKYKLDGQGGNELNYKSLQKTRIYLTKSSHWRETNSTTMTFAARVKTLREDYQIWKKYCPLEQKIPSDFFAFLTLTQNDFLMLLKLFPRKGHRVFKTLFKNWLVHRKPRKLLSPVPAWATHSDIPNVALFTDWKSIIYSEKLNNEK
jgi:hypothetical protein